MPLIKITTKPPYHPQDDPEDDTSDQAMVAKFAEALPDLFVANVEDLHMDPDTPAKGVQVSHKLAHARDVNAPDIWVLIEFSEGEVNDDDQVEVTGNVKEILLEWFVDNGYAVPADYACDVRWSPSHGFLHIDGESLDW